MSLSLVTASLHRKGHDTETHNRPASASEMMLRQGNPSSEKRLITTSLRWRFRQTPIAIWVVSLGMKREEAEDIDVRFINAWLLQPLIILDLTA
jgi:hypothetical protein